MKIIISALHTFLRDTLYIHTIIFSKLNNNFNLDFGDLGAFTEEPSLATEALCFMVVGVNQSWRLPFGYFFVAGLSGKGNNIQGVTQTSKVRQL